LASVSVADVRLNPDFDPIVLAMASLLFVAVGLVLLVACVNLAGFFLARATDRRKEMAVRVAMGAGKGTILRQLLVESIVLASLGGAMGLFLGGVAVKFLVGMDLPMEVPMNLEAGLNMRVLLFAIVATALATLLFGLTPALEAMRAPVASTLRDEAGSSGGVKKAWVRRSLVGAQMTLSTVLLVGAGLFLRSLKEATEIDVGFDTGPAAVVNVESWASEYTTEEMNAFVDEILEFARSEPGVSAAGVTARLPLALGTINNSMTVPGVDPPPGRDLHTMELTNVTSGYFEAMGIDVLEGRAIQERDRDGTQDVAVITRAAAELYWPGESAIGRVVYYGRDTENPVAIIGVVEDTKIWSLTEPARPYFYLPWAQNISYGSFSLVARGNIPAPQLAGRIRDAALRIDPDLYLSRVGTLDDHLDYIFLLPRMAAFLLTLAGVLALVLACVGLYGMVSYSVARRTREVGIRMALGAESRSVVALVVRSGLILVVTGGLIGLVAAVGLGFLAQRFLIGVAGLDPFSLLAAPAALFLAAGVAAYLPARRASRVNPVEALRSE
jgi:predicted permease